MRSWMAAAKRFTATSPKKTKFFSRRALGSRIGLEPLEERAMLAVFHVALSGNDGNDGSAATPYRTIQQAITAASAADDGDDIIRVAGGVYNIAGVDLGFTINADAELDTLDIAGSWNATFTTQDIGATPTTYVPQDAGGQITVNDADVTLNAIAFGFDGTNSGIVIGAGNFTLDTVVVNGAVDGVVGDGLTGNVSISNSIIGPNLGTGVQLTNHTGDLLINSTEIANNGVHGVDFEGSNAFVSIQTTGITGHATGVGARIANPGGQVSFGNNSVVELNGTGIVVDGAAQLNIDATDVDSNTLNGLTASSVTGLVSLTGSSSFSTNGFIGANISTVGSLDVNNIDVDNNSAGGLIAAGVTGLSEITNSNFGGNSTGLGIDGSGGVTLGNVTANGNTTANGLTINNGGAVQVTGGNFNTNAAIGIEIKNSLGVTLDGLTANENIGDGINLATVGAVILTNVTANLNDPGLVIDNAPSVSDTDGTYSNNLGSGVVLTNIGASGVTLSGTDANENGGDGIFAATVAGAVAMTTVTSNMNGGDGVHVEAAGAVTWSGSTASDNDDDGAHFEDVASVAATSSNAMNNTNGAGLKALNVTGAVTVDAVGLNLNSAGMIVSGAASVAIDNSEIVSNTLSGVDIEDVTGLVEITDTPINLNQFHGISVASAGALTISLVEANNNSAAGLVASGITGDVSITSSDFNGNSSGIAIDGANKVEVDDVSASNNSTASGLVINNVTGAGTAVIVGGSSFNGNAADGMRITNVVAQITIENVEASDNGEEGFDIDGAEELELADLTLKGNVSGVGGKIDGVGQLRFIGTTTGVVADLIEVTGTSITHTRAGDAQQVINYTSDTFRLSVSGKQGDDTIRLSGTFTLGVGDGLTVLADEGNDLIEANGVKGFGANVPMLLHGDSGTDTLTVNTLSGFDDLVELESEFVSVKYGPNAQAATGEIHEYEQIEQINIATAGGNDSVVVTEPTPNGVFPDEVNIDGGDENDGIEINLGKPSADIVYNVEGGTGSNGLTIFTRSASDNNLTFSNGKVEVEMRTPPDLSTVKTINYFDIRGINAYADAGNDTFIVDQSNLGVALERLSMFGQGDNDLSEVNLSDPALAMLFQFDGGAGGDNRLAVNTESTAADFVSVDSLRVRSQLASLANPFQDVEYTNVQSLQVFTDDGDDQISVSQAAATPNLPAFVQILSDSGEDQLTVSPANVPNTVELNLQLGADDDLLIVQLPAGGVQTTLVVDGGGEVDGDDVFVIGDQVAANIISAGTGASNVDRLRLEGIELLFMIGGAGADVFTNNTGIASVLDGLGGNDTLTGGSSRDFILGEGGLDDLSALAEEDLLVSGPVSFDLHVESLFAIMYEWTSGRTFEERIANINGTGVGPRNNGDVFLQPTVTVFDEGALDLLTGGTEDDWFLAQTSNDQVLDQQNLDDVVTVIP